MALGARGEFGGESGKEHDGSEIQSSMFKVRFSMFGARGAPRPRAAGLVLVEDPLNLAGVRGFGEGEAEEDARLLAVEIVGADQAAAS